MSSTSVRVAWVGAVALVLVTMASSTILGAVGWDNSDQDGVPYTQAFFPASNAIEALANSGDGQAFGAIATDPTISSADVFRGNTREAAYRWQRPLFGYLGWLVSGGNPDWLASSLWVITMASVGLLAAVSARIVHRHGGSLWVGAAVVLFPGVMAVVLWTGPEALGAALALGGCLWWQRRRTALAVFVFVLAALCRETLLLIPFIIVVEAFGRRQWERRHWSLSTPALVFIGWIALVHGRLGIPFVGMAQRMSEWTAFDWFSVVALVVGSIVTWGRCPQWRGQILGHWALASVMGHLVWARSFDFGRPLLPLYVLSTVGFGIVITELWTKRSGDVEHALQRDSSPLGRGAVH
jgi:hypothetical protein